MTLNRTFFFDRVRLSLFGGSLKQTQVDGLTTLLDYWETHHAAKDDRWLAYVLGTAYHEVDRRMQPIHEYGSTAYFMSRYDISGNNPKLATRLGNNIVGDGATYHGRGFVQLTGKANYQDWENRTGQPLVAQPDLVIDTGIATRIIFEGMIGGTFTGRQLSDYFSPAKADWVNARRIVNGLDKANMIAGYGQEFYAALSYTL
jgi:putative chitinase